MSVIPTITPQKSAMFAGLCKQARKICIVTHFHPDGDALGSATALESWLKSRGCADVSICLPSPMTETLSFLAPEGITDAVDSPLQAKALVEGADLIVCLDISGFNRTESLADTLSSSKAVKVLIDHHLNPAAADFSLVFSETAVSSACELLFWLMLSVQGTEEDARSLPPRCARSLMAGMTTDTNNFANSVFPSTLRMASMLLEAGVDRDDIIDRIFRTHRENRLRALGFLLDKEMRITEDGVAYMIIDKETADRFCLKEGETEGFVNEPLTIGRVKMSILLKEDGGHFRVSIRSKRGVSANLLAREHFHGGGHEQASGGKLFWPADIAAPEKAKEYIEDVTARFMRKSVPPQNNGND